MNNDENSLEQEFQQYAESISKQTRGDMVDPLQALTAEKNALDAIKLLSNYGEEIKDISKRGEFMRIIAELSMELAETKIRLAEKIEETESLKAENRKLKDPTLQLIFDNKLGLYFENNGLSDRGGPFCNGCYDKDKKTIRLSKMPDIMNTLGKYKCPVCNATYS